MVTGSLRSIFTATVWERWREVPSRENLQRFKFPSIPVRRRNVPGQRRPLNSMDVLSAAPLLALGGAAVLSHWITASANEPLGAPMDSGRERQNNGCFPAFIKDPGGGGLLADILALM